MGLILIGYGIYFLKNNNTQPGNDAEKEEQVTQTEPISIEKVRDTYKISISIDKELPRPVREKVLRDMERAVSQFKEGVDEVTNFPEHIGKLWLKTDGVEEFTGSTTRSLEIPLSEYTGGAHGNLVFYTYTFTTDGKILTLGDVLGNDASKISSVRKTAESELLKKFYADIEENLKGASVETIEEQKHGTKEMVTAGVADVDFEYSTWVIDGNELVLIFPPYSVAPYAYGTQEARIQLSTLSL